jgi:hypothetical protein
MTLDKVNNIITYIKKYATIISNNDYVLFIDDEKIILSNHHNGRYHLILNSTSIEIDEYNISPKIENIYSTDNIIMLVRKYLLKHAKKNKIHIHV